MLGFDMELGISLPDRFEPTDLADKSTILPPSYHAVNFRLQI